MDDAKIKRIAKHIRKTIILMSLQAQSAHMGGSLSCVEILVSLYFRILHIDPKRPTDPDRDRLVFSKAHDAKALYATLAQRGFFDKTILQSYETDGGRLAGHATRGAVPGIEISAGALGHGLPIACGMAYALKKDRKKARVFVILSDGECDEGSTWEAALFAAHHHLDNVILIIDYNKLQAFGFTKDVLNLEPFVKKWQAFGFGVKETDGHSVTKLVQTLSSLPFAKGKPSVLIAHTIKGYGGVKRHVNQIASQYKPPSAREAKLALKELKHV